MINIMNNDVGYHDICRVYYERPRWTWLIGVKLQGNEPSGDVIVVIVVISRRKPVFRVWERNSHACGPIQGNAFVLRCHGFASARLSLGRHYPFPYYFQSSFRAIPEQFFFQLIS